MTEGTGTWWIFCRVVDNFGDAGVSWRLARQLALCRTGSVHLVVDHWATLARLEPALGQRPPKGLATIAHGVRVWPWEVIEANPQWLCAASPRVLISAFGCELPTAVASRLGQSISAPLWLLLDYLSAESWVEGCHGRPSPVPGYPGPRYFYFPGFGQHTGGLLREPGLLEARDAWQRKHVPAHPERAQRWLTLWAYPDAPWLALSAALRHDAEDWGWNLFEGVELTHSVLAAGLDECWHQVLPFQLQPDYDRRLWEADLNLVRGEDSFVRAQWAGKPFLWHIYPQQDGSHWRKLEAFLACYLASLEEPLATAIRALFMAWNGAGDLPAAWQAVRDQWGVWEIHARRWSFSLAQQADLVTQLVDFVENTLK